MNALRSTTLALLCAVMIHGAVAHSASPPATEQQVKAVFVYNFTHFAEWPPERFASPTEPLVIGVLGSDDFAEQLGEAVRGERVGEHPLEVRRLRGTDELGQCHILYIDRAEAASLEPTLRQLTGRGTLTVSDVDGSARRGAMIEFARSGSRIRLLVNVDSARAAGLTLSSKLLRPAEIVRTERSGQ